MKHLSSIGVMVCGLMMTVPNIKTSEPNNDNGVSNFWADDYRTFQQVYGKTSDLEIYGENLPAPISQAETTRHKKLTPKKQKEKTTDTRAEASQYSSYDIDANTYRNLKPKRKVKVTKTKSETKRQPEESVLHPIQEFSPESDPETYNYYKQLEQQLSSSQSEDYPSAGYGGFKPYGYNFDKSPVYNQENYKNIAPIDNLDSYRSIQDIIESQDPHAEDAIYGKIKANPRPFIGEMNVPFVPDVQIPFKPTKPKPNYRIPANHYSSGKINPCSTGRCRKRSTPGLRYRSKMPKIVRKIKHKIIYA